ncbi:ABC transporter ATP-binding protein [Amaricoccus sp.]|uniref:iron ABC transporter ATP-binding protein n=1 Tax=Amaricoccus sp. TaxID=1872485 RepID=UPI001B6A26E1|nr:ATP-binding cassette domain-containing protein [Amaricoccus sp.]MBP7000708.1 ATP-binding cassette domain-containing protein [Amaricoccus sp.]
MIEIEGVSHAIGRRPILRDVTLAIPRGGVTALIGPNGAGKSTLLSLIARLIPLRTGRITVDGLDVTRTPSRDLALKLAALRQDTSIATRLTVRDLVGFGRYPRSRGRPGPADAAAVAEALARFELDSLAGRFLDELSGGQRQRALVAMTFAQETDYILLDEPLNNLDMVFARSLMRRLRDLADDHGRTIVVVVHEINYAAAWADRIVALREGRVVGIGPPDEMIAPGPLRAAFGADIEVAEVAGRRVALHH